MDPLLLPPAESESLNLPRLSPGVVLDLREDCSDQMAECGLYVASGNDLGTPKKIPKGKPILRTSHAKRQSGGRASRTVRADPWPRKALEGACFPGATEAQECSCSKQPVPTWAKGHSA